MTAARGQLSALQRSIDRLARDVRTLRAQHAHAASAVLRQALRRRGLVWKKVLHDGCVRPRTRQGQDEIYQLFIANSDPDLAANLGVCLARYFRGQGFHVDGGI